MADNQNEEQQQPEDGRAVPYARFKAVNDKYRAALAELEAARQAKDDNGNDNGDDWKAKHDAAQAELSTLKQARMKDRAALAHGIPLELADKLSGDTADDIMADAKRLAAYIGDRQYRRPAPSIDADAGGDAELTPHIDLESIRDPAFYAKNRQAIWEAAKQGRLGSGIGAIQGGIAAISKVINNS